MTMRLLVCLKPARVDEEVECGAVEQRKFNLIVQTSYSFNTVRRLVEKYCLKHYRRDDSLLYLPSSECVARSSPADRNCRSFSITKLRCRMGGDIDLDYRVGDFFAGEVPQNIAIYATLAARSQDKPHTCVHSQGVRKEDRRVGSVSVSPLFRCKQHAAKRRRVASLDLFTSPTASPLADTNVVISATPSDQIPSSYADRVGNLSGASKITESQARDSQKDCSLSDSLFDQQFSSPYTEQSSHGESPQSRCSPARRNMSGNSQRSSSLRQDPLESPNSQCREIDSAESQPITQEPPSTATPTGDTEVTIQKSAAVQLADRTCRKKKRVRPSESKGIYHRWTEAEHALLLDHVGKPGWSYLAIQKRFFPDLHEDAVRRRYNHIARPQAKSQQLKSSATGTGAQAKEPRRSRRKIITQDEQQPLRVSTPARIPHNSVVVEIEHGRLGSEPVLAPSHPAASRSSPEQHTKPPGFRSPAVRAESSAAAAARGDRANVQAGHGDSCSVKKMKKKKTTKHDTRQMTLKRWTVPVDSFISTSSTTGISTNTHVPKGEERVKGKGKAPIHPFKKGRVNKPPFAMANDPIFISSDCESGSEAGFEPASVASGSKGPGEAPSDRLLSLERADALPRPQSDMDSLDGHLVSDDLLYEAEAKFSAITRPGRSEDGIRNRREAGQASVAIVEDDDDDDKLFPVCPDPSSPSPWAKNAPAELGKTAEEETETEALITANTTSSICESRLHYKPLARKPETCSPAVIKATPVAPHGDHYDGEAIIDTPCPPAPTRRRLSVQSVDKMQHPKPPLLHSRKRSAVQAFRNDRTENARRCSEVGLVPPSSSVGLSSAHDEASSDEGLLSHSKPAAFVWRGVLLWPSSATPAPLIAFLHSEAATLRESIRAATANAQAGAPAPIAQRMSSSPGSVDRSIVTLPRTEHVLQMDVPKMASPEDTVVPVLAKQCATAPSNKTSVECINDSSERSGVHNSLPTPPRSSPSVPRAVVEKPNSSDAQPLTVRANRKRPSESTVSHSRPSKLRVTSQARAIPPPLPRCARTPGYNMPAWARRKIEAYKGEQARLLASVDQRVAREKVRAKARQRRREAGWLPPWAAEPSEYSSPLSAATARRGTWMQASDSERLSSSDMEPDSDHDDSEVSDSDGGID